MFTSLDLLVIVFMGLAALTLLSLCLMFLLRNKTAKRVCVYIVSALGIYMSSVAIRIGGDLFFDKVVIGIITALVCVVAIVLDILGKKNQKLFPVSRILAAAGLIIGFANAIL